MNELKKIELASLLLSEDKEIRILAINYIKSICKKNCTVRALWDFDTDDHYKMLSIIPSPNSPYSSDTIFSLLISILLEMIKKIMGYNDWFEKITNKIVSFLAY